MPRKFWLSLAATWLSLPALYLLLRAIRFIPWIGMDGVRFTQTLDLWVYRMAHGSVPLLYVAVCLAVSVFLLFAFRGSSTDDRGYAHRTSLKQDPNRRRIFTAAVVMSVVAALALVPFFWLSIWKNGKDRGRFYANSTVFYVANPANVPDSVRLLVEGASVTEQCDRQGAHDVFGCLRQGTLPVEGWDPRVSSFRGAQKVMEQTAGETQRASLAVETVTYLNKRDDAPAVWSGILDGTGKERSMVGVVEWPGRGNVKTCKFEGDYALKRAFGGERGNSMGHYLADMFPKFRWTISDVWGYCDGDEPIVVVPVTKQVLWKYRTVDVPAGIVTIRGSGGKEPRLNHYESVEPGTYPGPVYPMSMVETQRDQAKWTAGRQNADRNGFGYEPTAADDQEGNVSEYLLRDARTGRLVFVTPLTLRESTSDVFVTYAVTYADEVQAGELNELSLYVLEPDDPRRINIDKLANWANDWMSRNAGNFKPNGGKLIEYTPVNGEIWRVFGELRDRVVYQLDISLNLGIRPRLVSLSADFESGDGATSCESNVAGLTDSDLVACMSAVTDEVARRFGG